jgi:hypothetical protein
MPMRNIDPKEYRGRTGMRVLSISLLYQLECITQFLAVDLDHPRNFEIENRCQDFLHTSQYPLFALHVLDDRDDCIEAGVRGCPGFDVFDDQ